jgi:Protein of unknown function (Hypoth_ymh)
MRALLNGALAFAGLAVDASGVVTGVEQARTLSEAQRRAQELRADLSTRGVHPDVLRFCREELVADDYFHAVLEAVKSIADKIRTRTGLTDDGNPLIDRALARARKASRRVSPTCCAARSECSAILPPMRHAFTGRSARRMRKTYCRSSPSFIDGSTLPKCRHAHERIAPAESRHPLPGFLFSGCLLNRR